MKRARYGWLVLRALFEIGRYEVILRSRGFERILSQLRRESITARPAGPELEQAVCDAVLLATCFYWKPVLCLQRAVCTVRLLRRHGILARLVIGYRPSPVLFTRVGRGRRQGRLWLARLPEAPDAAPRCLAPDSEVGSGAVREDVISGQWAD